MLDLAKEKNREFKTEAPAKLNITLDVKGVEQPSGYHILSSIMQTVSLGYPVSLERTDNGGVAVKGCEQVHKILRRAIGELSKEAGRELSCNITIPDKLLLGAGMGIDSSLAAGVLRLGNEAFELNLQTERLHKIASKVGSDVQFLVYGGRALCEGGSEHKITPMFVPPLYYVIAKPEGVSLSTPTQYALIDKTGKTFTELAFEASPLTKKLYDITLGTETEHGVTGKGPTVFWGYKRSDDALVMEQQLDEMEGISVFSAEPVTLKGITAA